MVIQLGGKEDFWKLSCTYPDVVVCYHKLLESATGKSLQSYTGRS